MRRHFHLSAVLLTAIACTSESPSLTSPTLTLSQLRICCAETNLVVGQKVSATLSKASDLPVAWTSSAPAVLQIVLTGTGSVTMEAVGLGTATLTARLGSESASVDYVVSKFSAIPLSQAFIWSASTGMKLLDPLPGTVDARPAAINDAGDVVGAVRTTTMTAGGVMHAFLWSAATGGKDLGTLPNDVASGATSINASDIVVGYSVSAKQNSRPFIWSSNGGMQELPLPSGAFGGRANAINASGEVVGYVFTPSGVRGYRWSSTRGNVILETLDGTTGSLANGISDDGTSVGFSWTGYDDDGRAVLWSNTGVMQELRVSSCHLSQYEFCTVFAQAMSPSGIVAGTSANEGFIWSATGGVALFSVGFGSQQLFVSGVNDAGMVAGSTVGSFGEWHAFVWRSGSGATELAPPAFRKSTYAAGINAAGQVVGFSQ